MTDHEIAELEPAFAHDLERFRPCFRQSRAACHFDTFCRGRLSPLPRESVEPIALEAGTAVLTLKEFLTTPGWDHDLARERLQRRLAEVLADLPADDLGTIGVIDETSSRKWWDQTPGVQRQYPGSVGKIDNGLVTRCLWWVAKGDVSGPARRRVVPPGVVGGGASDAGKRGFPDGAGYRAKWRRALYQLIRPDSQG